MTKVNIPILVQQAILDVYRSRTSDLTVKTALEAIKSDNFDVILSAVTDEMDEITVFKVSDDIFIEVVDHYNRDVTYNFYEKYETE